MSSTGIGLLRRYGFRLAAAAVSTVLLLAAAEGLLRLSWSNPYRLEAPGESYVRLHRPGLRATVSASRLYASGGEVVVATDAERAIRAGVGAVCPSAVALGGSTTESALVPEGLRWPDLVPGGARNYGVSGNTSVESYWNLLHLTGGAVPQGIERVYLTHAVNDLRAFLGNVGEFSVESWRQPPVDLFSVDDPGQRLPLGLTIRDSWLLSLIRFTERELRGRTIFDSYLANRAAQAGLPVLGEAGFRRFDRQLREELLPQRAVVLERLAAAAAECGLEVAACSQPHAFRADFDSFEADLRLYPVVNGRRMTIEQAAAVMAAINRQSMEIAARFGWLAVDTAACIAGEDPDPLFYDSVHLTPVGSRVFADCLATALVD
jgi:hypothetical protein